MVSGVRKIIIKACCLMLTLAMTQAFVFAGNIESEEFSSSAWSSWYGWNNNRPDGYNNWWNQQNAGDKSGGADGYGSSGKSYSGGYTNSEEWRNNYKSFENVGKWSEDEFSAAVAFGLVPGIFQGSSMSEPVTRREFCYIALLVYEAFTKQVGDIAVDGVFTDCSDPRVIAAYKLGIVSGYEDFSFKPDSHITRQELFKLMYNLLAVLNTQPDVSDIYADHALVAFSDTAKIQKWAVKPTCVMLSAGITNGVSRDRLDPLGETTREQAAVMAYRVFKALTRGDFEELNLREYSGSGLGWPSDGESAKGWISNQQKETSVYEEKYIKIFGSLDAPLYKSNEEASANMVSISVPVWNFNSAGEKVSTSRWLTVHKNIADTVKLIFKEIYEGAEKFPIYSVGGYSWRGNGTSEHNWGIAIDINADENYMIKDGAVVAGSLWQPGVNKYSIPEDGDVVRAFAKYGFAWGGNAWKSSNDYMHFSYFGK
jgi:hypothetical protein